MVNCHFTTNTLYHNLYKIATTFWKNKTKFVNFLLMHTVIYAQNIWRITKQADKAEIIYHFSFLSNEVGVCPFL